MSEDTPCEQNEDEEERRKFLQSPRYKLHAKAHKLFPCLINHPLDGKALTHHYGKDAEENAETSPPEEETIKLRSLFAIEFYTPEHADSLITSFKNLEWKEEIHECRESPSEWIEGLRLRHFASGGMYPLGVIKRYCDTKGMPRSMYKTAPLPECVDYAIGEMHSLTSSLSCIVIKFIFKEEFVSCFDKALRENRKTFVSRSGVYRTYKQPEHQKADHILDVRSEIIDMAQNWFKTYLPGIFSSGEQLGDIPTCEFVTLKETSPYPEFSKNNMPPKYLRILDLESSFNTWVCSAMEGLKLSSSSRNRKKLKHHATISIKESDLESDDYKGAGYDSKSGQIALIFERMGLLLCKRAIIFLLDGYTKHLSATRDSALFKYKQKSNTTKALGALSKNLSRSIDTVAVTSDLLAYVNDKHFFAHDVPQFYEYRQHSGKIDKISLIDAIAFQTKHRAEWIKNIDTSLRDIAVQYGSLISAEESAKSQKATVRLTWVVIFLTLVTIIISVKDSQSLSKFIDDATRYISERLNHE